MATINAVYLFIISTTLSKLLIACANFSEISEDCVKNAKLKVISNFLCVKLAKLSQVPNFVD